MCLMKRSLTNSNYSRAMNLHASQIQGTETKETGDMWPATGYTDHLRLDVAGLYYACIETYIIQTVCICILLYRESVCRTGNSICPSCCPCLRDTGLRGTGFTQVLLSTC